MSDLSALEAMSDALETRDARIAELEEIKHMLSEQAHDYMALLSIRFAEREAAEARAIKAEAALEEAVKALEPFAKVRVEENWDGDKWVEPLVRTREIRAARATLTTIRETKT